MEYYTKEWFDKFTEKDVRCLRFLQNNCYGFLAKDGCSDEVYAYLFTPVYDCENEEYDEADDDESSLYVAWDDDGMFNVNLLVPKHVLDISQFFIEYEKYKTQSTNQSNSDELLILCEVLQNMYNNLIEDCKVNTEILTQLEALTSFANSDKLTSDIKEVKGIVTMIAAMAGVVGAIQAISDDIIKQGKNYTYDFETIMEEIFDSSTIVVDNLANEDDIELG